MEHVQSTSLSRTWLLVIQFAANVIVTVFLSYHALELAQRAGAGVPVQSTVIIVACAVIGILLSTGTLIWKPELLAHSSRMIAVAGIVLGGSLALRATVESFWLISFAGLLSGAAVGLNSSALFATALDHARTKHGGKLMGIYSAAGAAGQVVGPMIALGILYVLTSFGLETGYRALFFVLALLPLGWAMVITRTRSQQNPPIHSS